MSDEVSHTPVEARLACFTAPPPPSSLRSWLGSLSLAAYGLIVLLVTLTPIPVDQGLQGTITRLLGILHRRGLPEWFGYNELEFTANIAMFVPLGLLLGLALPRQWQWLGLIALPLGSGLIEGAQLLFLTERFATWQDVLANSLGGWLGLLVAALFRAAVYARDRKLLARARWYWERGELE